MHPDHDPSSSARGTLLTTFLCFLVIGILLVFMVSLMGMFVLHALGVIAAVMLFGVFHYFLWGRSMTHQMTEEQQNEQAVEEDGWPPEGPHGHRRS